MSNIDIYNKAKSVLFRPTIFFEDIKSEAGIKRAFIYYTILFLISFPFFLLRIYLKKPEQFLISKSSFLIYLGVFILYLIIFALSLFLGNLIFHYILVKAFGGKEAFYRTFQANVYSITPVVLLAWIPYVNILAGAYSIILGVIGLSKLQELSIKRAILIYLLSSLVSSLVYGAYYITRQESMENKTAVILGLDKEVYEVLQVNISTYNNMGLILNKKTNKIISPFFFCENSEYCEYYPPNLCFNPDVLNDYKSKGVYEYKKERYKNLSMVKKCTCYENSCKFIGGIYEWMSKNIPRDSTILAWSNYGHHIKAINKIPIISNPAKSIVNETMICKGVGMEKCLKHWEPLEDDNKVKDIAEFYITSDLNKSFCLANKYKADYILINNELAGGGFDGLFRVFYGLSLSDLNKTYNIHEFITLTDMNRWPPANQVEYVCELEGIEKFREVGEDSIYDDFCILNVTNEVQFMALKEDAYSTLSKLYFFADNLGPFELVHMDPLGNKLFKINYPENINEMCET